MNQLSGTHIGYLNRGLRKMNPFIVYGWDKRTNERVELYDTDYKDHAILFAKKYTHSAGGTGGWDMVLVVYKYQSDVDWEDNPVYEEKVLWSCWNEPMRWSDNAMEEF